MKSQSGYRNSPRFHQAIKSVFWLIFWLTALGLLLVNRQNLFDWWRLHGYNPPSTIAALAADDQLTVYGRKIFYVNHPQINQKSSFSKACPNNGGEQTIVIGCYHSNQRGINILEVDDPRLSGVEQVTAGHEMLHAAYDRLNPNDRRYVNELLNDYYHNHLDDERVKGLIVAYQKTEPDDLINEMHSIFGTEVANLPPALENYYKRYFLDRTRVVAFATAYKGEFTSRQQAVKSYDAQLAGLKAQIDASEVDLKVKQATLEAQKQQLDDYANSGNVQAHNALVPTFNNLLASYRATAARTRQLVDQYNQIVAARNAIVLEEETLTNEINAEVSAIDQ